MTAKKSATEKSVAESGGKKSGDKKIRVQQVRSPIGFPRSQREVLRSLGLRRIRQVVEHSDNPAVRGMVNTIPHLVQIIEEPGSDRRGAADR